MIQFRDVISENIRLLTSYHLEDHNKVFRRLQTASLDSGVIFLHILRTILLSFPLLKTTSLLQVTGEIVSTNTTSKNILKIRYTFLSSTTKDNTISQPSTKSASPLLTVSNSLNSKMIQLSTQSTPLSLLLTMLTRNSIS